MDSSNDSIFWVWKVSPFGNPRILRLFAPPRGLSQLVTSFIGSQCQGIPLVLLLAWTLSFILHILKICAWAIANRLFFASCNIITLYFSWKDLNLYNNLISFCLDLLSPIHFSMSALGYLMNTHQKILWFKYPFVGIHFSFGGLKWIRTTDLTLIRRAL